MKRSTKFYRRNEREVMKKLGFRPTINSGAGDIEKEDGENEVAICQLKSTDAGSISIKQNDLHVLEYHAAVSHKIPVFAIQFLNTDEVWLCLKPEDVILNKKNSTDIFDFEEKNIDRETKTCYNDGELNKARENLKSREAYNNYVSEERERREKEFKEKRRENRRRRNLNSGE